MTRLKKIAIDMNLKLEIFDEYLDILNDNIYPTHNDLEMLGIGAGYDDTISYITYIKDEYTYMLGKADQVSNSKISSYIEKGIKLCNDCLKELDKWYDVHEKMPTETDDDMAELEAYEYVADKLVIDLMKEIDYINKDIENEIVIFKKSYESSLETTNTSTSISPNWYNSEDGDLMTITVNSDGSVYGRGNKFDFEADDVEKAIQKLRMWNYYEV